MTKLVYDYTFNLIHELVSKLFLYSEAYFYYYVLIKINKTYIYSCRKNKTPIINRTSFLFFSIDF